MRIKSRWLPVLTVVSLLGIVAVRYSLDSKPQDQEWVMAVYGKRIVCRECGKLMGEQGGGKRVRYRDRSRYRIRETKSLCAFCAMRHRGFDTAVEYLFEEVRVQSADRVEIHSVSFQDRRVSFPLKSIVSRRDKEFRQIIAGIKGSRSEGTSALMIPDAVLRWYVDEKKIIEMRYCSVDHRLEIPIKGYPSEHYLVFLSGETGGLIGGLLK